LDWDIIAEKAIPIVERCDLFDGHSDTSADFCREP
jgi:hypothetical protein